LVRFGLSEIVEHAVAVIRPEMILSPPNACGSRQQRLQHRDHVDVAVEMIGFEERQPSRFAFGRAQMRKADPRCEFFWPSPGQVVLGAAPERAGAETDAVRLEGPRRTEPDIFR
jgi:hypothetical protein